MTESDATFLKAFIVMMAIAGALVWDAIRYDRRNRDDK